MCSSHFQPSCFECSSKQQLLKYAAKNPLSGNLFNCGDIQNVISDIAGEEILVHMINLIQGNSLSKDKKLSKSLK